MMTTNKQIVTIKIKTEYDQECSQEEYNRLIGERQTYINKGFSEQQAKYFNRRNEDTARQLDNGLIDCLVIDVIADILMPCGHYQEVIDSLGGVFVSSRKELLDMIEYHGMIDTIKNEVYDKLKTRDIEFIINEDF